MHRHSAVCRQHFPRIGQTWASDRPRYACTCRAVIARACHRSWCHLDHDVRLAAAFGDVRRQADCTDPMPLDIASHMGRQPIPCRFPGYPPGLPETKTGKLSKAAGQPVTVQQVVSLQKSDRCNGGLQFLLSRHSCMMPCLLGVMCCKSAVPGLFGMHAITS
jgi:hypothetical protein